MLNINTLQCDTGFGGLIYDVIMDKANGLSWSCEGCRQRNINL